MMSAVVLLLVCGMAQAQDAAPAPETLEGTFKKVDSACALMVGDKTYMVIAGEKADDATKDLITNYETKLVHKGAWTVTGATKTDANGKQWIAADTIVAKKNTGGKKTGAKKTGKKTQ